MAMFMYSHWMRLSMPTRIAIATIFGIAKTGSTHIADNRIQSDGYRIEDIENALNIDKLQEYLSTDETDMAMLFNMLIDKVEGRMPEKVIEYDAPKEELELEGKGHFDKETGEPITDEVKEVKKRGRPSKTRA